MKKINSIETLEKYLMEGYGIKYIQIDYNTLVGNTSDYGILVDRNGNETDIIVGDRALESWLSMAQRVELKKKILNGEKPTIMKFDLIEAKKIKRQKAKAKKEAIEYFKGFEEGNNITITSDFLNNLEALLEALK